MRLPFNVSDEVQAILISPDKLYGIYDDLELVIRTHTYSGALAEFVVDIEVQSEHGRLLRFVKRNEP
jgi:hypothetical protein